MMYIHIIPYYKIEVDNIVIQAHLFVRIVTDTYMIL